MQAALWKRRSSLLIACFALGAFASEATAQAGPCLGGASRRYTVRIDSSPQGADIYIGDKSCGALGKTPWEGKLPKGTWNVVVEKDGYELASRSLTVRRTRKLQEISLAMVKKADPPRIDVRPDADKNTFNAEVFVDGEPQGKVPVVIQVREGRHLIQIKKDGFKTFEQWVEVKEGVKATVNPVLEAIEVAKKGSILVEADVSGAEVFIDGTRHPDPTPTLISDVIEGPHVIEVKKDPAAPWKQTVSVVSGKTVKVSAELKASMKGRLKVISNIEGARVFLDGVDVGPVPADLQDVKPGEHVVEVKAPGFVAGKKRVTITVGSAEVLEVELQRVASKETGKIKVVSPVPEATVFIDGERIGTVPQEKELPPGEHYVVVQKPGYKKFEEKVKLVAGQSLNVSAELRAVGALRILSNPPGAEVTIDGDVAGKTPFNKDDIDVGEHIVVLQLRGHYNFEKTVDIKGGERTVVRGTLEIVPTGPTAEELEREQRGLSSFGARALPLGRSTLDLAAGYPYYVNGQITVGAPRLSGRFPFDAGILVRTFVSRNELALKLRLTLAEQQPFSVGLFTLIGGGSAFDGSGRNDFFLDAGLLASLTAPGDINVTGRVYLDIWSDRHCDPMLDNPDDQIDVCTDSSKVSDTQLTEFGFANRTELQNNRETGVRLMLSIIAELALQQRWTGWILAEGAPFQSERAAYTNFFNTFIPFEKDRGIYVQTGLTYKF